MDYEAEKQKIIDDIHKSYKLLFSNLDKIPKSRWEEAVLNKWSIKDMISHIVAWQQKLLDWHIIGKEGGFPETPAPGYKWNQLFEVNDLIYQEYKDIALKSILEKLEKSHKQTLKMLEEEPAEHFFTRGSYPWLKNSYFKSYVKPSTSGHYNWMKKHVRKWAKDNQLL